MDVNVLEQLDLGFNLKFGGPEVWGKQFPGSKLLARPWQPTVAFRDANHAFGVEIDCQV